MISKYFSLTVLAAAGLTYGSITLADSGVGAISEKPGGARMGNQSYSASKQEQINRDNERKMQNEMNQYKGKGSSNNSSSSSSTSSCKGCASVAR